MTCWIYIAQSNIKVRVLKSLPCDDSFVLARNAEFGILHKLPKLCVTVRSHACMFFCPFHCVLFHAYQIKYEHFRERSDFAYHTIRLSFSDFGPTTIIEMLFQTSALLSGVTWKWNVYLAQVRRSVSVNITEYYKRNSCCCQNWVFTFTCMCIRVFVKDGITKYTHKTLVWFEPNSATFIFI